MRISLGIAAVTTGVVLIGTTGLTFAVGWSLWAGGLALILGPHSSGKGGPPRRRPRQWPRVSARGRVTAAMAR
jgi:hypothetical protein